MTNSNLGDLSYSALADEYAATFNKSAFNDLIVVDPTPIVQALGNVGLTDKLTQRKAGTGAITASNGLFEVATGATSLSFASLLSQTVPYKARMGCRGTITGKFTTPVANSLQVVGFTSATDRLAFGYSGTTFGIFYDHHGQNGIWKIEITTGATGAGTASVTLNGTLYSIPVTAGTIQHTAYEIAAYLKTNATNHTVFATDDEVTIMYDVAQPATGAYTFSSTGGVVGSMSVVIAGARATTSFIPQSSWDDPCPWLTPTNLNVFEIMYQYLGAGRIMFAIEGPDGVIRIRHTIKYSNNYTQPSLSDPGMRVGITVASLGSTTNLKVSSACFAAFIDGKNVFTHDPHILEGSLAAAGTTPTNMLTIRNKRVKGTRDSRVKVRISKSYAMTTGTKGALVRFIKNGTPAGDLIFYDYDETHSVIQYSTSAVAVTGSSVGEHLMGASSGDSHNDEINIDLEPGDTISMVGSVIATPTAYMLVTAHILEDM